MHVIIPAAGSGQRFRDAGYSTPKPFIRVGGVPMIRRVLDMVHIVDTCPTVIIRKEDVTHDEGSEISGVYHIVDYKQPGPALSVLCANGRVPEDEPVMVVDCDNEVDTTFFDSWRKFASDIVNEGACAMLTTHSYDESTNWAFIGASDGQVLQIREKTRISTRIYCGMIAVPNWRELRYCICKSVAEQNTTNGEYYLAPALCGLEIPIYHLDIPSHSFHTFGTPEALKAYEEYLQCR